MFGGPIWENCSWVNSPVTPVNSFITAFGRYCYKRLPKGISFTPEQYMRINSCS